MTKYPNSLCFIVQPDDDYCCGGGNFMPQTLEERIKGVILSSPLTYTGRWQLLGLLIGQASSELVKSQLMPRVEYWNCRTGKKMHIICVGFGTMSVGAAPKRFLDEIEWLQGKCKWRYSGETDLLVMNARIDGTVVSVETNRLIALTLEDAIRDEAIKSVPKFIERMITFAEGYTGDDPMWGFSDEQAKELGCSALKAVFLHCLPKALRKSARAAFYFHVKESAPEAV